MCLLVQNLSFTRLLKSLPENPEKWHYTQHRKVSRLQATDLQFDKRTAMRVRLVPSA